MKVVQADGRTAKSGGRVVKNVSGYDMTRLHIGALGTLGIIAEASFKLTPLPASQKTVVAAFDDSQRCLEAGLCISQGDVVPLALTSFDRKANERMGAINMSGRHFLAVRLGGRPLTLERQIRECRSACGEHGSSRIEVLPETDAASMWRRLADFGWAEAATPHIGARAFVLPTRVQELADRLEKLENGRGIGPALVTHPAHGTVLMGWFAAPGGLSGDAATGVLRRAAEAVHQVEGRMIIERCPLEVKSHFDVWDDVGGSLSIMRNLKEQYDPKGILNPGRFVGGI